MSDTAILDSRPARIARARRTVNLPAVTLGLGILLAWAFVSRTELISQKVAPAPQDFLAAFASLVASGSMWAATAATVSSWLISLTLAIALAGVAGVMIGSLPVLHRLLVGLIEFFRPIPSVAILPLALLLFGPSDTTKIVLTTYTAFWPMLVQTIYGVSSTDPVLKDVAATNNIGPVTTRARVILPSALPSMAVGLRIGASMSLILCVTLELIVGMDGIGREIFLAQSIGDISRMYAYITIAGLLGWAVNAVFQRAERSLLHWHASHTAAEG